MTKTQILSLALCIAPTLAAAQTGINEYLYDDAAGLWRMTDNAAGLALDSARTHGVAQASYRHSSGNHYRVQEGMPLNGYEFFTERYQPIGKALYGYGKFRFTNDRIHDRAWSDVYRTYDSDPYMSGSSRPAAYDDQRIELTAAVGTKAFGRWRMGMRLDYNIGDLSRLRDPRSRSELLDYKLTPALTYTMGSHTLGISGYYNRRKEKIVGLSTVATDAQYVYYLMSGLENAVGTMGGYNGYVREWVNHKFGATLSYAYHGATLHSLNSVGISRASEGIYGTYKYQPGHYYEYEYALSSRNRLTTGKLLHQIDLSATYRQGYADEYRQTLSITTDSTTGYNSYHYLTQLNFKKRYQVRTLDLSAAYRLNFTRQGGIDKYIGIGAAFSRGDNEHLLSYSNMKRSLTTLTADGGMNVLTLSNGSRLWAEANMAFMMAGDLTMNLSDPTTAYAQNVWLKDADFYSSSCTKGGVTLTYQFPLTVKKHRSMWFVKATYDYLHADTERHNSYMGLTLGIIN